MKTFIDSSVFLRLLLDEPGSDIAQTILGDVEYGRVVGYVIPIVLKEVCFKLMYAKASEVLNTKNVWKIKECLSPVKEFYKYIDHMFAKGLRTEPIMYSDWIDSFKYMGEYGLPPADAIHVAVVVRVKADAIASFDEDFKRIKEIKIIPT